jgi:hypothetical protein
MDNETYQPGEIIIITSGTYDDYTMEGVFLVLRSFDTEEVCEMYKQESGKKWFFASSLIKWLEEKEYIKQQLYEEWWIE